ncbi:RNase H domain-containing protein [Trichonephila clavipes]|uniref:RNase H domain-containing protein n=1 Tax=Trichonephila clavipes TaxID=2585209 RepID=A0A8X6VRI5_TRICX|nr:RNase H domain-containing protein [Trichonephila clavipes]
MRTGFEGTVFGGPSSERIDQEAGEVPSAIEKTIVSPRSTVDSEPNRLSAFTNLAFTNRQAPGGALSIKADRVVQTTISRLASGHIRGLSFNLGQKIYENCTKCNLVQATPDHLLFCAGLEREDIYSSPLLVYDFLRTLGLMDLV